MGKMLVQMFNSIFSPEKVNNEIRSSFFIPFIIMLLYFLSPNVELGFNFVFFIITFTYMSNGLRFIFSKKDISYILLSASSPLIFGIINEYTFIVSAFWSVGLKSYYEIKNKNFYSFILGAAFDMLIIWWYL
ncbi:hypothetical protein [Geotoga petraea]|uniref:Uncharacterized protein n=1 Tax=Geotoga petraea TaxID=28234 RepID=A0A4Z0W470_9BACT|nr:hypothetical protein [Geotoga petraea]TGG88720.1 hypothetical protein E4650_00510 [Geotoga petraea]